MEKMEMDHVPEDAFNFLVIPCRSHLHYLPMSDVLLTLPVKGYSSYANAVYGDTLLCPDVDTLTLAQSSSSSQSPSRTAPPLDLITVAFM